MIEGGPHWCRLLYRSDTTIGVRSSNRHLRPRKKAFRHLAAIAGDVFGSRKLWTGARPTKQPRVKVRAVEAKDVGTPISPLATIAV